MILFTKKQEIKAIKEYSVNMKSMDEIAFNFGCSRNTIRNVLVKNEIRIRKGSDKRRPLHFDDKDAKRFYNKVDSGNKKSCWMWNSCIDSNGYGRFGFRGKLMSAHRVAWELKNGDIPEGVCVLHSCDTPGCCNPDHLFLGTHQDNMNDRNLKGRARGGSVKGIDSPNSKFTNEIVIDIRKRYDEGEKQKDIAKIYGTSQPVISWITTRKGWQHI